LKVIEKYHLPFGQLMEFEAPLLMDLTNLEKIFLLPLDNP